MKIVSTIKQKLTNSFYQVAAEAAWRLKNKPVPPPHFIKQKILKKIAGQFALRVFVETGTYKGGTTMAMKDIVDTIYSIELDKTLFERAQEKFSRYSHIHILQGDSAEVLPSILSKLNEPALFWLDGHYSAGITAKGSLNTPIIKELELILDHHTKGHVILIDDARCFVGKDDYPTIEKLTAFITKKVPKATIEISDDIIRVLPWSSSN